MIKALFIVGPTASGKTDLSIRLAKALDGEIICADSPIIISYKIKYEFILLSYTEFVKRLRQFIRIDPQALRRQKG